MRFPRLQPGDRLSAELVNRMLDALEMVTNMTADSSSGIELVKSAGNVMLWLTDVGDAAGAGDVVLRVTSTDPEDLSDGLYPAVIESCTNADSDPPTWSDGDACWAVDPNGGALAAQRYNGTSLDQTHSDGSPVFSAMGIGVGASAIVRVTSTTLTDSMYPCDIESWADGVPPAWGDSDDTGWLFPPNGETYATQRYVAAMVGIHSDGKPVFSANTGLGANGGIGCPPVTGTTFQAVTGFNLTTCVATLNTVAGKVTLCGMDYPVTFTLT